MVDCRFSSKVRWGEVKVYVGKVAVMCCAVLDQVLNIKAVWKGSARESICR